MNLKKALTVLEVMNFNDLEREVYEGHIKWLMDEASTLGKRYEKGIAEGEAKGHAVALKQVVAKMLAKQYGIDEIAELIGLNVPEVTAIVAELKLNKA